MTAKEMIAILQTLPEDTPIHMWDPWLDCRCDAELRKSDYCDDVGVWRWGKVLDIEDKNLLSGNASSRSAL